MKNILYQKTVLSIKELNELSEGDGETKSSILVTEENNGFIVWYSHPDENDVILKFTKNRFDALEFGVMFARDKRNELLIQRMFTMDDVPF